MCTIVHQNLCNNTAKFLVVFPPKHDNHNIITLPLTFKTCEFMFSESTSNDPLFQWRKAQSLQSIANNRLKRRHIKTFHILFELLTLHVLPGNSFRVVTVTVLKQCNNLFRVRERAKDSVCRDVELGQTADVGLPMRGVLFGYLGGLESIGAYFIRWRHGV